MLEVPSDGLLNAFFELEGRFPAEFVVKFGGVDRISKIVPCTVSDECYEAEAVAFRMSEDAVNGLDHHLDEVDILPFVETSDVVGVAVLTFVEDEVDGTGMVFHIEPVTDVFAFAIDREGLTLTDVVDEERDKLLGKLVGAVVVRAVGYDCREAVGIVEGADEVVG